MSSRRDQIMMTSEEIEQFLDEWRTMTLATVGPGGQPHLVAMWYGMIDGDIVFLSYRTAQKVKNLERNPRITVLAEDGEQYPELRGVSVAGRAELVDDPGAVAAIEASISARFAANAATAAHPEASISNRPKRVGIRIKAEKTTSWDHKKLAGHY